MNIKQIAISLTLAALTLSSCSDNQWRLSGSIADATEGQVILEATDNGMWYPIDTVEIGSDGKFIISHAAPTHPNIFRLNYQGKYAYFPIDSLDRIRLEASAANFGSDYRISGTAIADRMQRAEQLIRQAMMNHGQAAAADSTLKRQIGEIIMESPADIVAYYLLNKRLQGTPLFNPTDKHDLRMIGAVANAYNYQRPNDPRTAYLSELYLSNRRMERPDTIVAAEIPLIDIALLDNKGAEHRLSDVAAKHRVTLLNFTSYGAEFSPALNVELNRLYGQLHGKGLEIYQVGLDGDEYQWRMSAKNLPWITVFNSITDGADYLMKYNVTELPTTFLIVDGELRQRIDKVSDIAPIVNKLL